MLSFDVSEAQKMAASSTSAQDDCDESYVLLHEHCFACITPKLCAMEMRDYFCPVVACFNSCGAIFHVCKAEEHLLLCPRAQVPCINAAYGCHTVLLRCETAKHLQVCPASVVICGAEWNRKLIDKSIKPLLRKVQPGGVNEVPEAEPDIALARRDQGVIRDAFNWPKAKRQLRHTCFNSHFPVLPFTPAASDSFENGFHDDTSGTGDGYVSVDSEDETLKDSAIARDCRLCRLGQAGTQHLHVLADSYNAGEWSGIVDVAERTAAGELPPCVRPKSKWQTADGGGGERRQTEFVPPPFYAKRDLLLRFAADFLPAEYRKPRGVYTFCCEQALRRDQIAAHAQFLHGFIMPELSNRIIHRCPMHLQGCDEFQTRFVAPSGFRLAFNAFLDSFVLRQPRDHLHDNQARCDHHNGISLLLQVPEVILHRILSQLDSASLYCLSATCSFLRDACAFFLPVLGVTDFEWRRVLLPPDIQTESVPGCPVQSQPLPVVHVSTRLEFECGVRSGSVSFSKSKRFAEPITGQNRVRWVPGPQRWRFTKMIEPVKECSFALSTMGEHIQHCPFYKPLRRYGRVKMYPELDLSESCTDEEIL